MPGLEDSGLTPRGSTSPRIQSAGHDVPRVELPSDVQPIEVFLEGTRVSGTVQVPPSVFNPNDPWAQVFRRALGMLQGVRGDWLELGVGAGVNVVRMVECHPEIKRIYGSDYVAATTEIASRNFEGLSGLPKIFVPLQGSIDILKGVLSHPQFDARIKLQGIFGCLPQVPYPHAAVSLADAPAHYFDIESKHYVPKYDRLFLGLQEATLVQSRYLLEKGGRVVLNLAGRVPLDTHLGMFDEFGYDPKVVHQECVTQHAGTSIAELVHAEQTDGVTFTFYPSEKCNGIPMSATVAQTEFLDKHAHVYHPLYVIEGTLRDAFPTT